MTLVAIVIAVILAGFLLGSVYEVYVRRAQAEQVGIELAEASQNARAGVELIARDLRSAGFGVNPQFPPTIVVGSQYRVTLALDMNGNHRIDRGEIVTYFLDPSSGDPLVATSPNPFDFVVRREVSAEGDSLARPVSGRGEIVAYGVSQRSRDTVVSKDVPLFSYRDEAGAALELKPEAEMDPDGVFFGRTVSKGDLGIPPGAGWTSQLRTVQITMVTETKQRSVESGGYDRVTVAASAEPGSTPYDTAALR
jgi:hypothetical protein